MRTVKEILAQLCTCGHELAVHSLYLGPSGTSTCIKRAETGKYCSCSDFSSLDDALAAAPCHGCRDIEAKIDAAIVRFDSLIGDLLARVGDRISP